MRSQILFKKKMSRTKTHLNEDFVFKRKDSEKSNSSIDRLSIKNRNSDSEITLFVNNNNNNNSETTNSDINISHKTLQSLHKIKFGRISKNEEDERNKSGGPNTSFMNTSYYFKTHNISYICNLFSNSIGYESIWRFPYYFINAEGAVFFFPFLLFYFLLGIPVLTIESALGQIFKRSPIDIFSIIKEKLNYNYSVMSIKIITLFIVYIISLYFASLTSQCIHYFLLSFSYNLPWSYQLNVDKLYHSTFFKTKFINHDSTHQNFDIFRLGDINYHKLMSTFITWLIFYLLIIYKIDRYKHKYLNRFLSFFPIIIIFIVFIVCFHPSKGFKNGYVYFLIPKMEKLLHYRPWICGINQAIFLLMLGSGKNYLFSSTIKEKDNVYSRSTLTSLIILFIGIFCTFFNCVYAGLIAEELNIDSINNIPFNNSNIPFISYLLALGMMKYNRLFSILFLFSLIIIGFQSQILIIRNFSKFLHKLFPKHLNQKKAPVVLCIISFIFCIPFTRFQGQFFLEWIDRYISLIPLIFVVFYEIIFIMKKLGINLLLEIISNKTSIVLPLYIFYFTKYITPIVLIMMMILAFMYQYDHTQYSTFTKIIEWIILLCPFIIFLIFFIRDFLTKEEIITKDYGSVAKKIIGKDLFHRKKERKQTHQVKGNIDLQKFRGEERKNSSFSYGHKSSNLLFSNEDLDNDIGNDSIRPNIDSYPNENYNFVSESNTRKATIEMQYLDKNNK